MDAALRLAKLGARFVVILVVFDVIGALMSFLLIDVWSSGGDGPPVLAYVLWGVLGLLCGALSVPGKGATLKPGLAAIGVSSVCLGIATTALYFFSWRGQGASDPYVPDSASLTCTFFVAILGGMGVLTLK